MIFYILYGTGTLLTNKLCDFALFDWGDAPTDDATFTTNGSGVFTVTNIVATVGTHWIAVKDPVDATLVALFEIEVV